MCFRKNIFGKSRGNKTSEVPVTHTQLRNETEIKGRQWGWEEIQNGDLFREWDSWILERRGR